MFHPDERGDQSLDRVSSSEQIGAHSPRNDDRRGMKDNRPGTAKGRKHDDRQQHNNFLEMGADQEGQVIESRRGGPQKKGKSPYNDEDSSMLDGEEDERERQLREEYEMYRKQRKQQQRKEKHEQKSQKSTVSQQEGGLTKSS